MSDIRRDHTVDLFYRSLPIRSLRRLIGQILECGAEHLDMGELHCKRVAQLIDIQCYLSSRAWHIHAVKYAILERHAKWIFYASQEQEPNPWIMESLDRWHYHQRMRGYDIRTLLT